MPLSTACSKPPHCFQSHIDFSPLRPHVPAHERLTCWQTPYSFTYFNILSKIFPVKLIRKWRSIIEASVDQTTRKNYAAGLLRFNQFCNKYNIPENLRMPASEELLALFIADFGAGIVAGKTVSGWLTGLEFWHTVNGAPWRGGNILKRTKQGVSNLAPSSSSKPEREPITYEHMLALRDNLDLGNSKDTAIWAAACVAFKSCCRLGELLIDSRNSFDPSRNVSHICSIIRQQSPYDRPFIRFKIPWSKTDKSRGAWIYVASSDDPVDARSALEHHFVVNKGVPSSAPLFAFQTTNNWCPLTRASFMSRCESIWSSVGLSCPQGHGFRIGGATFLLLCGVDPWIVMKQGRWSSKAFLRYWRKIDLVLSVFLPDSSPTLAQIRSSITHIASLS